jgi:hypothetical protein
MIDQAAELLGVSRRTVYYRIRTWCNSQRVLVDSLHALMGADPRWFRDRGAGVSDRDPATTGPSSM